MKRILLLSDAGSEHTEKWALGLASKGFKIGLFSITPAAYDWYSNQPNLQFLNSNATNKSGNSFFSKLNYLGLLPQLKRAIKKFNPQIVHAHYASSYGLLARLSGFTPYFISAWGTDVMKFPYRNFIFRKLLIQNLEKASMVFATSETIKSYIAKLTSIQVKIIYFGVDVQQFKPSEKLALFDSDAIVIAAIKPIEPIYCTDILLEAFAILSKKYSNLKLRLLLVGEGSLKEELQAKVEKMGILNQVKFTGRVNFNEIARYFNTADIFVNISEYESFGVSVIEASACEKPVVVTDVGGLKEIVEDQITGFRVPVRDVEKTAWAIEQLLLNTEQRISMGKKGRLKVIEQFDWESNLNKMVKFYTEY